MQKAILFGAGESAEKLFETISDKYNIVGIADNNQKKWGKLFKNMIVSNPAKLCVEHASWDKVIITSLSGHDSIIKQLIEYGIDKSNIDNTYVSQAVECRNMFLQDLSYLYSLNYVNSTGACAEAGVFQGDYAKYINEYFPDRKLYLFDTFSGFNNSDQLTDIENNYSDNQTFDFSNTSVELVLSKMKYPNNCIIKKGYFPETTEGISEEFVFVNLDFDLYAPISAGLKWFGKHMAKNSTILVHDYFSNVFKGVKNAVDEYISENKNLRILPIGDKLSVAIVGF